MYEKEIDSYMESYADFTVQKTQYREELGNTIARLNILMAKHIDKSSASFENKIQLLLKIPEIEKEVIELNNIYFNYETKYKNYRDFAELYKSKVIEYQSRRKSFNGV